MNFSKPLRKIKSEIKYEGLTADKLSRLAG